MMVERVGAVFMPHGLGHFLGIDTHDPGGYLKVFLHDLSADALSLSLSLSQKKKKFEVLFGISLFFNGLR